MEKSGDTITSALLDTSDLSHMPGLDLLNNGNMPASSTTLSHNSFVPTTNDNVETPDEIMNGSNNSYPELWTTVDRGAGNLGTAELGSNDVPQSLASVDHAQKHGQVAAYPVSDAPQVASDDGKPEKDGLEIDQQVFGLEISNINADQHNDLVKLETLSDNLASSTDDSSDSDSSSADASSDDEDTDAPWTLLSAEEQARMLMQEEDGGEDGKEGRRTGYDTYDDEEENVPVEKPDLVITPEMALTPLGTVENIFENRTTGAITIKSMTSAEFQVVDIGSVVCLEDRTVVGSIWYPFGPTKQPMYLVRFAKKEEIKELGIESNVKIYYINGHVQTQNTKELKNIRPSDASNQQDAEIDDDEIEFSDDEKESAMKQARKFKRKTDKFEVRNRPHEPGYAQPSTADIAMNYDDEDVGDMYTPLHRPDNLHNAKQPPLGRSNFNGAPSMSPRTRSYGRVRRGGQDRARERAGLRREYHSSHTPTTYASATPIASQSASPYSSNRAPYPPHPQHAINTPPPGFYYGQPSPGNGMIPSTPFQPWLFPAPSLAHPYPLQQQQLPQVSNGPMLHPSGAYVNPNFIDPARYHPNYSGQWQSAGHSSQTGHQSASQGASPNALGHDHTSTLQPYPPPRTYDNRN